jgi:hypothetical protein
MLELPGAPQNFCKHGLLSPEDGLKKLSFVVLSFSKLPIRLY